MYNHVRVSNRINDSFTQSKWHKSNNNKKKKAWLLIATLALCAFLFPPRHLRESCQCWCGHVQVALWGHSQGATPRRAPGIRQTLVHAGISAKQKSRWSFLTLATRARCYFKTKKYILKRKLYTDYYSIRNERCSYFFWCALHTQDAIVISLV